jgi:murein DD-endopeptidase MepM/ murein hydrolase activator NlpD
MRRLCLFAVLFAMPLVSLASDTGRKDSYVLRDGGVTFMLGEGMSAGALKKLQEHYGSVFLWARREGRTYLFRDETTLDAARAVVSRNASVRAEQEKRMATVVDTAIRSGAGRSVARGEAYVFRDGDTQVTFSSGTSLETIRDIQEKFDGDYLWIRRGGRDYVICDALLLDRVSALFAPQRALGPQQQAVGREEAALDREEEALDDESNDDATRARLAAIHSKQELVGRREAELDRREEELERRAEAALWPLVDDAIRQGIAKRLN